MNRLKNLLKRRKGDKDQDKKKGEDERIKGDEDEEEVEEEKGDDLISKLADETLLLILAGLPASDLCNASLLSKRFNALANDNSLWESIFTSYCPAEDSKSSDSPTSWKERLKVYSLEPREEEVPAPSGGFFGFGIVTYNFVVLGASKAGKVYHLVMNLLLG